MLKRRLTTVLLTLAGCALAGTAAAPEAVAHGSMQNPLSRVEGCYLEGAENPKSAACKAAVAAGGTAALYDWMSLRIGDAAGQHRGRIPDGKLCSAGNEMYKGMDLARADWPATNLTPGSDFTFRFRATAPHKGTFQLFLTNSSYDPAKPLAWSNLDAQPFVTVTDPQLVDGSYVLPAKIPAGRTGRQLVYAIWQRSDSPEAFYSCSDVVFDGSGSAPGSTPVPPAGAGGGHSHPATPTAPGTPGAPTAGASAPGTPPAPAVPGGSTAVPAAAAGTTDPASGPAPAAVLAAGSTATAGAASGAADPSTVADAEKLAQTGSDRSLGILASIGSAFLLAGGTVFALRRGRRTPGAHAR
ncbi:chitin-binding protein [Kitasatospora herbaricolor]|uniref:lytic polysaccharide monooxygenase auxiliary activity family 9 protein n=1 Tax=Kitasatospora herbaricolor TaxID=68217 RepID=UPI00174AA5EF|nr:lytic polysaccharide monooxygenase [Kitasatospora herbaricolor]MDQ0308525.1 chitin-binding protein [Kitasatospora herbaricolor]GGV13142.1 chitin-binding protein [Kitasatospora herbaricolor]